MKTSRYSTVVPATMILLLSALTIHGSSSKTGATAIDDSLHMMQPTATAMPLDLRITYGQQTRRFPNQVVGTPVRGVYGDWWADIIIGQPSFSQITPNEVVGNKLFNPGGVYVDRSVQPNRVYVYDAGNSRVLGLSHLGMCPAGSAIGHDCTSNSDCPGSRCPIQEDRIADIVLGQPSLASSPCNGDSAFQNYPNDPIPTANTLCGLRVSSVSTAEGGAMATMATDSQGNLYFPDLFNNRVLRYNDPFGTDSTADYVWGQSSFSGASCNKGLSNPNNTSLCLAPPPGFGMVKTGVAIDASRNLWVADTQNNRVLRFPFDSALGVPAQVADLVLGQPDFSTTIPYSNTNRMNKPASVRVDNDGKVYVADGALGIGGNNPNSRILVFYPPFSNGMPANEVLSGIGEPTGLEIDPRGGIWVNDVDNQRLLYFLDGVVTTTVNSIPGGTWGGIGVDRDSNVMIAGWDSQQALRYSPPSYIWDATFFRADEWGSFNKLGPHGIYSSMGIELASGQLIVNDGPRILFWNNIWNLGNYMPADGVIGQPDFYTRPRWVPHFGRMRADRQGRLWVVKGDVGLTTDVLAYELPLRTGAEPILTVSSPVPLKGGGVFTWTGALLLSGIAFQPNCDCLWLSDTDNNRVFRIKDVSTSQRIVDIVIGQQNVSGTHCNQGRDSDNGYDHPTSPSRDSLCHPGGLAFDNYGNLYVADHNLEVAGNWRLMEYDADLLPASVTTQPYDRHIRCHYFCGLARIACEHQRRC